MKFEKLGEILSIHKGRKNTIIESPSSDSVRVLQIDDLRNDNLYQYTDDKTGVFVTEKDLMIVWDGANAGTVGYGKQGYIGSTIAALRKKNELYDTSFLGLFLKSQFSYFQKNATGATIPHIDRKSLENLMIPHLSLETQIHISNILSKTEVLIQQRKETIALLDEHLKSTFLEMFYTNPIVKTWNEIKFEELAEKRRSSMRSGPFGSSLLHSEFSEENEVKVLGIDNVVTNRFTWKKNRGITKEKFETLKRYRVYPKDVLISIMATLGRTAVVPDDIPLCINSKHLAAISLDKKLANPHFIAFAFHSHPTILKQLTNSIKGAIMDGLNLTIIKNIKLLHPPIELQNQFAQIVEKVEVLKEQYKSSLLELENLYGSLSAKAFRGEMGIDD